MLSRAIASTKTVARSAAKVAPATRESVRVIESGSKSVPEFTSFVKQWADDMDYRLGPTVAHSSTASGLTQISPRSGSAAAMQSNYGLSPSDSVVFAYNPKSYANAEDILARSMQETASEAARQGGSPTAYLAKMPISGIRTHADLPPDWFMSSKPLRVIASEPLFGADKMPNTQKVEDLIARASGGMTKAERELDLTRRQKALAESLSSGESVA